MKDRLGKNCFHLQKGAFKMTTSSKSNSPISRITSDAGLRKLICLIRHQAKGSPKSCFISRNVCVVIAVVQMIWAAPAFAVTADELSQILMKASKPITQTYQPNGVHAGIDFGSTGDGVTTVYAPVSGTITENTSACGKVAIYDGSNTIILAHMTNRTTLAVGSTITAGTPVGKASKVVGGGCTATAAHLHIEIRTGNNTSMALPTANNTATTKNPLTYPYDLTAPTINISAPATNATLRRGSTYTISWTASDSSGLGDSSVTLISGSATTCNGATAISTMRAGGDGYVNSIQWTVPSNLTPGTYKIKVAVRDGLITWGCTMRTITIQ